MVLLWKQADKRTSGLWLFAPHGCVVTHTRTSDIRKWLVPEAIPAMRELEETYLRLKTNDSTLDKVVISFPKLPLNSLQMMHSRKSQSLGLSCAQHLSEIFRTNKKPRSSHYKTFVVPMRHHWPLRKLCNTIRLWKRFICEPWESHQPVWLLLVECWKRIPHSKNPNLVSTTWWMPRPSPCLLAAFKRWFSLFSVWTCIDVTTSNRSCFSRLYKVMGHSTTERLLWEQHEKKKI